MFWDILIVVVIIYVIVSIVIYFWQERLVFKPEKLPEDFEYRYPNQKFTEHNIRIKEGVNINGLHFHQEKPKGIVFYLKGNSRSIKGWGKYAIDFVRLGYDVAMVDYRGFGKSTGKRTEKELKNDLQVVYDMIKEQVDEKYIILYGRSMGSGFAAKLASRNNPRMLILESPYYSLSKAAARYAPFLPVSLIFRFPIRTYKWLPYVNCPIKIIHGTNDTLIPYKTAVSLSKIKADNTRLYSVIGGNHNDLHTFEEYHRMLEEILTSKAPVPVNPDETSLNFKRDEVKDEE